MTPLKKQCFCRHRKEVKSFFFIWMRHGKEVKSVSPHWFSKVNVGFPGGECSQSLLLFLLGCHCSFENNNPTKHIVFSIPHAPCIEYLICTYIYPWILKPFILGKIFERANRSPALILEMLPSQAWCSSRGGGGGQPVNCGEKKQQKQQGGPCMIVVNGVL